MEGDRDISDSLFIHIEGNTALWRRRSRRGRRRNRRRSKESPRWHIHLYFRAVEHFIQPWQTTLGHVRRHTSQNVRTSKNLLIPHYPILTKPLTSSRRTPTPPLLLPPRTRTPTSPRPGRAPPNHIVRQIVPVACLGARQQAGMGSSYPDLGKVEFTLKGEPLTPLRRATPVFTWLKAASKSLEVVSITSSSFAAWTVTHLCNGEHGWRLPLNACRTSKVSNEPNFRSSGLFLSEREVSWK